MTLACVNTLPLAHWHSTDPDSRLADCLTDPDNTEAFLAYRGLDAFVFIPSLGLMGFCPRERQSTEGREE